MELEDMVLNDKDFMRLFDLINIGHDFGWYGLTFPILNEIHRYNKNNPDKKIYIRQIKQKWGRLVIYTTDRPEYLDKMILKARHESSRVCELCGAAGRRVDMYGCVKTVCDEHLKASLQSLETRRSVEHIYKELLDAGKYGDDDSLEIYKWGEGDEG